MKRMLLALLFTFACLNIKAQSLNFDGVDDYVDVSTNTAIPVGNDTYTIEAWFYANSMGTEGIIGWGDYGNNVNALRLTSNGIVNYWWGNDLDVSTGDISGVWHHVAVTYDGTTRQMYLDGSLIGSDIPGSNAVPFSNNLTIGRTWTAEYFNGSIDELRIWNVARTQGQIQDNMNCSLSGNPQLVANYNFNEGIINGNNPTVTTLDDISGNINTGTLTNFTLTGTSSNWVSDAPLSAPITALSVSASGTTIAPGTTVTFTATATNGGATPTYQWMINNSPVGSNSNIYSSSTLSNNDTITCILTSSIPCAVVAMSNNKVITVTNLPASLNFDGIDDYVSAPLSLSGTSGTWESWIQKDDWTNHNDDRLFGNGINFTDANSFYVSLHPAVGFHFRYGGSPDANNMYVANLATKSLAAGSWHHLAATWNFDGTNTTIKIYLDGAVLDSAVNAISIPLSTPPFYLGGGGDPANPFFGTGSMDEVRVWNVVRTTSQIQNDMSCSLPVNQSGLIANYNFNSGTPNDDNTGITTLKDVSGNNNDGTLNNFDLTGTSSNWTNDVNMVTPLPITGVYGIGTICQGASTNLIASGSATSYAWSVNAGSATTNSVNVSPDSTSTFVVTGTNGVCMVMDSITVTVNLLPSVTFDVNPNELCSTDPAVTLSSVPAGGTYSGTSVSANMFDPGAAGIGTYILSYIYTDGNNCSNTDTAVVNVISCIPTGINYPAKSTISVHPNPANDILNIEADASLDNAIVEIYDVVGKKVIEEELQNNLTALSLNKLTNGLYQIRVINNNVIIYQSKIVKQ